MPNHLGYSEKKYKAYIAEKYGLDRNKGRKNMTLLQLSYALRPLPKPSPLQSIFNFIRG